MKIFRIIIIGILYCLSLSQTYAQKSRVSKVEIIMKTKRTGGETVTFQTECQSSPVWDEDGFLTNESKFTNPIELIIYGDTSGTTLGWDSNDDADENIPRLGCAELNGANKSYLISVENKNATLAIDCYGYTFLGDVYIMYDNTEDKFFEDGTTNEVTCVDLYDDPEYLQPTEPRNFTCTNPNETKAHPNFTWEQPAWPYGARTMTIYYRIFRNDSEVDDKITTCSWTDPDVVILPDGDELTYYAKAYLAHSPDSDPSNSVSINGGLAKQFPDQQFPIDKDDKLIDNVNQISLSVHPNPFNPATTISFQLPRDGYVRITVFNLAGQRIAELANGNQSAGFYQLAFNGQALAGGIYLVRLQLADQFLMRKILLLK